MFIKLKNLNLALIIIFLSSCYDNHSEIFPSIENLFNATECLENEITNFDKLEPLSIDDAVEMLQDIKQHKNISELHSVETIEVDSIQTLITISSEKYINNKHMFELQFHMISYSDDSSLFYRESKAYTNSKYYDWQLSGFGLSSNNKDGTYNFKGTSYLYFNVIEESIKHIQIPVQLNGNYEPSSNMIDFDYSF